MDYKKLQNGSDVRGVALEGIEGQNVNLTEEVCRNIGRGFALWLINKTGKKVNRVAVGRDSRLSGPTLSDWLTSALTTEGEIFYFNEFNHATVQRLRIDPTKELENIKIEAVANELVLGIAGISIGR